jgi:uncharacterized protein YjbI with pentapeptide repeats
MTKKTVAFSERLSAAVPKAKWNKYTHRNSYVQKKLGSGDVHHIDIAECVARDYYFDLEYWSDSTFSGVNFEKCSFGSIIFDKVQFKDCVFISCEFYECEFIAITLTGCELHDTQIMGCGFTETDVIESHMRDCSINLSLIVRPTKFETTSFIRSRHIGTQWVQTKENPKCPIIFKR